MEFEESEFLVEDTRRYIVLVIYDIVENKRRTKMVKCLERYGVRAQEFARESINDWMLAQFGSRLYLALAWTPFAAQEFLPGAEPGTRGVFRRVGELLAAEKLHRYGEAQLAAMFAPESEINRTLAEGRECSICHTSAVELVPYRDEGAEACLLCEGLFRFGERLLSADVFGAAAAGNAGGRPARLQFFDLRLTDASREELSSMDLGTY